MRSPFKEFRLQNPFKTVHKVVEQRGSVALQNYNWWTDWIQSLTGGHQNAITVTEKTALSLTAVWSAVNLISNTTASLPFGMYEKNSSGKRVSLTGHPANRMLNIAPNRLMTPFSFKYAMQARVLLHGCAFAYIVRDGQGTPVELIPLDCEVRIETQNGLQYCVFEIEKKQMVVPYFDMFHLMGMTLDGRNGLSVLKYHNLTLGANLATSEFVKKTSEKGTALNGYLSTDKGLDATAVEALRTSWQTNYTGPNGFDTAILDFGLKYYPISMSMADAQVIEQRKFGISDIARIFAVPPHKIGDLERSTNNNIEHQGIEYVQDCIMPWTIRWENEISRKLVSSTKQAIEYPKYNLNGLMRGDSTARAAFYRAMSLIGVYSPNRILELEDEDGFEGGDTHSIEINRIPLDQLSTYVQSQIDSKTASSNTGIP